jgi:hypothetical protein
LEVLFHAYTENGTGLEVGELYEEMSFVLNVPIILSYAHNFTAHAWNASWWTLQNKPHDMSQNK